MKKLIEILEQILIQLKKNNETQENILRLFRKYDDEYVQEIAKDGFIEKQ